MINFCYKNISRKQYFEDLDKLWQDHLNIKDKYSFISCFAGIGGSSLGYSASGGKELLAIEHDEKSANVFKRNYPDVEVFNDDIKNFNPELWMEENNIKPYDLDILDGSPPCQGFSMLGKKNPNDLRNKLIFEYARIVLAFMPKIFVMENVFGILLKKYDFLINDFKKRLDKSYNIEVFNLNLRHYGLPQDRKRVFFIGIRKDIEYKRSSLLPNRIYGASKIKDLFPYIDKITAHDGFNPIQDNCTIVVASGIYIKLIDGSIRQADQEEIKSIQSFPKEFDIKENEKRLLGNCVPPYFVWKLSNQLKKIIGGKLKR